MVSLSFIFSLLFLLNLGVTLDFNNAKKFQFERFEQMVNNFGNDDTFLFDYPGQIKRTKESHIYTVDIKKKYKTVNTKGLISQNFIVYPFGYKWSCCYCCCYHF